MGTGGTDFTYVFFSKMIKSQAIPEVIDTLKHVGAAGVDLAVRDGFPVNPDNVRKALPAAASRLRDAGLLIPMVSASTSFTDPGSPFAEELWASAHDAGVRYIKIGYWDYAGNDYWSIVDRARRSLEAFAALAGRYGVQACLHTHSGSYVGLNASSVMHLAQGFDPAHIGVYLDPGHLNVNGEPLPMAFDMASRYLSLVAVKDSRTAGSHGKKTAEFVPLGQGTVDWEELIRQLLRTNFSGPISFHSEYETWPMQRIVEQTKADMAFLRRLERQARG